MLSSLLLFLCITPSLSHIYNVPAAEIIDVTSLCPVTISCRQRRRADFNSNWSYHNAGKETFPISDSSVASVEKTFLINVTMTVNQQPYSHLDDNQVDTARERSPRQNIVMTTSDSVSLITTLDFTVAASIGDLHQEVHVKQWSSTSNATQDNNQLIVENEVYDLFFSQEMLKAADWYFDFVVFPIIGVTGICGNIIGLIVLTQSGLDNPSNILLLQLTIADMLSLMNSMDITKLFSGVLYWKGTYSEVLALSTVYMLSDFAYNLGRTVSPYTILLITGERLLAIFCPLQFSSIVTGKRVWLLGLFTFLVQLMWVVFAHVSIYTFEYGSINNFSGGLAIAFESDTGFFVIEKYFLTNLNYLIPMLLVIVGCVIIFVKLSRTRRKRGIMASMTQSQKSSKRTTKTLLIVCIFFCATRVTFVIDYFSLELATQSIRIIEMFFVLTLYSRMCLYFGSSTDCIIYILSNKKYRRIIINMFRFNARKKKY